MALRAAVSAAVLLAGFRAVSDDDYARVVIAQAWARAPKLDPSGTSWLPFPFWLNGAAMLAFGRSLFVAQAVAFVLGIAATLLVALGALRVTLDRRAAFVAAAFATLVGWSAWLGVATVPECLTAALTFFAASSLTTRSPRARALGALALLAATLSRYEPWPVAIAFAAWNLIDRVGWPLRGAAEARGATADVAASRATDQGSNEDAPSLARRTKKARNVEDVVPSATDSAPRGLAPPPLSGPRPPSGSPRGAAYEEAAPPLPLAVAISALAVAGPVAWVVWNRFAHGEALHFVARVTAYRRALGEGANESVLARLGAYPVALAREMPEVAVPFAIAAAMAMVPRWRAAILAGLRRSAAPLGLAAAQVALLATALVKDGAPTHHPERAVLFPALAMAVFAADIAVAEGTTSSTLRAFFVRRARAIAIATGALLFGRAVITPALDRSWFAHRESEVAVGEMVAAKTPAEARVLVQAVDYGYFAIEAASGRPESFELDHSLDPRDAATAPVFAGEEEYVAWLRERRVDYVVSPRDAASPARWQFQRRESLTTAGHALSKVPVSQ